MLEVNSEEKWSHCSSKSWLFQAAENPEVGVRGEIQASAKSFWFIVFLCAPKINRGKMGLENHSGNVSIFKLL